MSSPNLTPEAQVAISHLRALTVSQKHPAKIRDLLRDYREIEGVYLPFKNYGFKTVEDFLRASGEFLMINYQGEISVTALPSAESAHIKQMVSRQSTKQRRRGPPARLPSRTDQSWNKSSFSSSNMSRNLRMPPIRRMNNNNRFNQNYNNNNNNYQQSRNNYGGSLVRQISGSGDGDANNNCNQNNNRNMTTMTTNYSKQHSITSKPAAVVPLMDIQIQLDSLDLRDRLNQKRAIVQQQPPLQQQKLTQLSRPILGQNGSTNQNSSTKDIQTFSEYLNKNHNIQPPSSNIQRNGQKIEKNNGDGCNGDELFSNYLNNRMNKTERIVKTEGNDQPKKPIIMSSSQVTVPNSTISTKKVSSIQNRLKITISNNITNDINNTPQPVSSENTQIKDSESSMPTTPTSTSPVISSTNCNSNDSNSSSNSIGNDLQYEFSIIDKAMKQELKVINEPKSMPKIFSNEFQFNPNLSSSISLAQYCTVRQLPRPHYDILKPRFGGGAKRIQCRVNINNIIYSTYPDDFADEESATEACAKIAIDDIKEIEHKIHVPLCMDSDCELALKIYQELKSNYPCGIFAKMFPDVFEKTFKQSLPDHWWTIIQDSQQFILESTAGDNFILFANIESESSTASNASEQDEPDNEYIIKNRLNLPWDDKYWNLYITHCVSTSEIWARIVHKDYSEKLDTLLTDIDMSMLSDKKRPVSLIIGQFYLVCISECWLRIRLDNIDKGSGKCLCFFVDFGDDDLLAMDQLYICDKKFLELPPQAIPFSLFGLEDFTENPIAKKNIDTMLLNKGLIAEIITKQENYDMMMKNYEENINNIATTTTNDIDFISKIQIVLYDTSSNEDVNLNPLLLNKICDETPPPELKNNGVTNVNITHINDNGEVYLQVRTLRLHYVEKLIHQLVQSKFKEDQHKVNPIDIKRSNLFLIKDNDDQRWYRGCLIDNDFNIDDQYFNIFYVDYGNIKNIPITNIFRLESLSTALNKFPWQAIKTKLHNLPPMNSNVVARIRGLLRINYPAIVKLAVLSLDNSRNVVPQIIAFVRIERSHSLCNVNEAIRMEHELESSLELENELEFKKFDSERSGNSLSPTLSPNYKHPSNVLSEMTACIRNVNLKSSTNKEPLPKLSSNCWIPDIGQLFNVLVTISSNPFNFLIQSYNDFPKYQDMMTELQVYCKSNNEYIPSDMIEVGETYAVLKSDNLYYRASVEGVFPSDMTCVFFCDCGDVAVVNNSAIKTLPRKFRTMPKQAIQAKLHGIKPVNGEWTTDDSIRFRELTLGHKFASVIRNISVDNFDPKKPKVLELTLIDVSTDDDIYIHEMLVNEKRAILSS